jgi:hypothetical protein
MNESGDYIMSKISTTAFAVLRRIIILVAIVAPASAAPGLSLRAPSAGTAIAAGTDCAIAWRATEYTGTVEIRLWDGERGEWSVIAKGIAARQGVYSWRVPDGLRGDLFRIEVRASASPAVAARSGAFLSIREKTPSVAALSPAVKEGDCEACIVRPNPCSSLATLELGGKIPLSIDMTSIGSGITYPRAFVAESGVARVPTDDLPGGAYTIRVRCGNGETVLEKLIIQHTD